MQKFPSESSYEDIICRNTYTNIIKASSRKKTRIVQVNDKTISISNREFQCVKLLSHGRRIKEIAKYLEISNRTVESYLSLLKEKAACYCHEQLVDFYWTYLEPKIIEI